MRRFVASFLDLDVAIAYLPTMLSGFALTIALAVAIVATGMLLGIGLALLRSFGFRCTNVVLVVAIDLLRALPPLAIIVIVYFALPFLGIALPGFLTAWLSLSFILAAFAEEIVFAAIASISRGQWDGGQSLGLSFVGTLGLIILPQALRICLAPLTSRAIAISKNTALASVIAVPELINRATSAMSNSGNTTPLTMAAVCYVAMFLPLVIASRSLERRFPVGRVAGV